MNENYPRLDLFFPLSSLDLNGHCLDRLEISLSAVVHGSSLALERGSSLNFTWWMRLRVIWYCLEAPVPIRRNRQTFPSIPPPPCFALFLRWSTSHDDDDVATVGSNLWVTRFFFCFVRFVTSRLCVRSFFEASRSPSHVWGMHSGMKGWTKRKIV